jgi:thioredoxin-dependent peroxiredoxin
MPTKMQAPRFRLRDRNGSWHSLSSFRGRYLVVYFYPKDNTPGCTLEALAFNDKLGEFKRLSARVIGISGGDEASKQKFCKRHGLDVLLLSDSDYSVAKAYGAYGTKSFMGRTFQGILRKTFVLDTRRHIIKAFDKVTPQEHPEEVLSFLAEEDKPMQPPKKAKKPSR